jgi:Zn-dependent protease with chaperone function
MILDLYAFGAAVGSWILTYLLHATVLLSGAALATIAVRARPEIEEAIWKLALVGGLLTASLQPVVAGWRAAPPQVEGSVAAAAADSQPLGEPSGQLYGRAESAPLVPVLAAASSWRRALLLGWATVTALLLARLLAASLNLRSRLADRRRIAGPLAVLVDHLLEAAGCRRPVRLTSTDGIPVPIALGGEICMPERALRELPPHEQETAVAHEMAHVLRRDPAWMLTGRILEALFFFHPLMLLAGRRLRRVAEIRCDDWAAAATGRPLALARCLTRVASWGGDVMPAAAMAGDPRWLVGRVTRLLDRKRQGPPMPTPRWLRPAAAVALAAMVLWMPGISLAEDVAAVPETPAEASRAPVAPLKPEPAKAPAVTPAVAQVIPAPIMATGPMVAPQPRAVPRPVIAPAPRVRPAFAIPGPGPLPPAELATLEATVAAEMAEIEGRLADVELEAAAALAEARQQVEEDAGRELERARGQRERLPLTDTEREELRRLVEELAAERGRMAEEFSRQRQRFAEQLADQRRAVAEQARQMAEQARDRAIVMETQRELTRDGARQLAEETEHARAQAHQEMERLAPELERLRQELRLRTDEREQLRRELEVLRRELESRRQKDE